MTLDYLHAPRKPAPPRWVGWFVSVVVLAFFSWLRLDFYADHIVPLSVALPLLLCLWNRDLKLLYGMAAAISLMTVVKVYWIIPEGVESRDGGITLVSQLTDVWVMTAVVHGLLAARTRLERKAILLRELNRELEISNEELAASNEELATREEEISHQNEELQSQAEELEQQAEALRQQAEEMEQQSIELHEANQELLRREKGLQTLLSTSRSLHKGSKEGGGVTGVCTAALQIMSEEAVAVEISADLDGAYDVWGEAGFGARDPGSIEFTFAESFASLALESGRTLSIEDLEARPDLKTPTASSGERFRSALATPIWQDGKVIAVLSLYSREPRLWTEHNFSVAEWLGGQAGLALQSLRFQQELNMKRQEAETAAVQKGRFLAAVSHDVRTPANSISLLAELIDRSASDPARADQVPALAKSLWKNARALVDLVSDVLDLTRMDADLPEAQTTEFSLHELIQNEVERAGVVAGPKGLQLVHDLPPQEIVLASDRTKLGRIISNLLSNAVKFTEVGHVRVSCRPTEGGGLRIDVTDSGLGIPPESLDHVFDEFFQLRNPERDKEKGTGLGLAICKRLTASLGCHLSVESAVGVGTTFSVHLPPGMIGSGMVVTPVGDDPCSELGLRGARILLVEDNAVAREAVANLLTAEGAVVTSAKNGREALDALAGGGHDALLLDLNLPDMDGSEILKSIQKRRPPSLNTILVVTGDARPERIEQVKSLGADGLVAKPVSLDTLRRAIVKRGGEFDLN
jgi:signal transduction histidine kinase/ActR/RegA family two-component response regulator